MNVRDDKPTREDAAYAAALAFFRRYAPEIALLTPLALMMLLFAREPLWAVFLVLVWLGEAIAYRLLVGPGGSLFARRRLAVYFAMIGFVALMQLMAWIRG